jgi:hypothetical protein
MSNGIVSHFKVYKVKLLSNIIPCDGTESLSADTKKYIKSKKFCKELESFLYVGAGMDLNLACIKVKKISHTYSKDKLTCNMEIAVSQSLNLENIRKHLKYSFGTFSKTGGFNGSFKYKTEHFCFTGEKLEIKDTKKLSGIKVFLKSKVLF